MSTYKKQSHTLRDPAPADRGADTHRSYLAGMDEGRDVGRTEMRNLVSDRVETASIRIRRTKDGLREHLIGDQ